MGPVSVPSSNICLYNLFNTHLMEKKTRVQSMPIYLCTWNDCLIGYKSMSSNSLFKFTQQSKPSAKRAVKYVHANCIDTQSKLWHMWSAPNLVFMFVNWRNTFVSVRGQHLLLSFLLNTTQIGINWTLSDTKWLEHISLVWCPSKFNEQFW